MTAPPVIRKVVIHPDAAGSDLAHRVTERVGADCVIAPAGPAPPDTDNDTGGATMKDCLTVKRHRGPFLKNCPGTTGYLCCGYRVLNIVTGCPFDCSYCILQLYLNQPSITVHSNWADSLAEIDALVRRRRGKTLRLGTGELADSLALEPITGMAADLLPAALEFPEVVLELKTKSTFVDGLLDIDHRGRVIISWSLNAVDVAAADEKGAPTVEARLRAAAKCRDAGYRIGFHFDPLIRFPGWREGYSRTVEAIYSHLEPGSVAWISLGALRYPPALDGIIRERFPESRIYLEELVPGLDGKLRYFRPLREEMFRHVYGEIQKRDKKAVVYLCMENPEVWRSTIGLTPSSASALARRLDDAACRRT